MARSSGKSVANGWSKGGGTLTRLGRRCRSDYALPKLGPGSGRSAAEAVSNSLMAVASAVVQRAVPVVGGIRAVACSRGVLWPCLRLGPAGLAGPLVAGLGRGSGRAGVFDSRCGPA